ncbi:MAG: glycosyltransferase family 4 protein [Planctomycetes bacterium]|nr:glycosyltransferase family 4 protein [Planctomycetota bacterium]
MSTASQAPIHVITAATSPARLDVLGTLRAPPKPWSRAAHPPALVVQVGPGTSPGPVLGEVRRVRAPFNQAWLATGALRALIEEHLRRTGADTALLHAWDATALASSLPLAAPNHPLLAEVESGSEVRVFARRYQSRPPEAPLAFACPTTVALHRLAEVGVPPATCALVRPAVDFGAFNRADATRARQRLGLEDQHTAVLVLPPVTRETGAFAAVWGTLLLQHVRADVRIVVPTEGPEVRRIQRLATASRHDHVLRSPGWQLTLPELLAATDGAIYLPAGDAPTDSLAWAMASGRPIVASAVPAVTEFLRHGQNAWLCATASPSAVARCLLQVLEQPEQVRRRAESARSQAFKVFSRQRMIEQYQRVYENLAAGRAAADGLRDAAVVA